MSKTRTTSPPSGPADLPAWSWTWSAPAEDLEAMLATDDDVVDTALIPTLAFRDAVEESAAPGGGPVESAAPGEGPVATTTSVKTAAPTAKAAAPAKAADTTVIPAVEVAEPEAESTQETAVERVAPLVGHSLRSRHATPESTAAIRRNLIAVCCVAVSVVIIGIAVGLVGGWIAFAAYALLVMVAAYVLRRINARYAPRHSRYSPRHA